jgi:hypothetical protein
VDILVKIQVPQLGWQDDVLMKSLGNQWKSEIIDLVDIKEKATKPHRIVIARTTYAPKGYVIHAWREEDETPGFPKATHSCHIVFDGRKRRLYEFKKIFAEREDQPKRLASSEMETGLDTVPEEASFYGEHDIEVRAPSTVSVDAAFATEQPSFLSNEFLPEGQQKTDATRSRSRYRPVFFRSHSSAQMKGTLWSEQPVPSALSEDSQLEHLTSTHSGDASQKPSKPARYERRWRKGLGVPSIASGDSTLGALVAPTLSTNQSK